LQKKEALFPTMWNVKSMLKRVFDDGVEEKKLPDEFGDEPQQEGEIETEKELPEEMASRKSLDELIGKDVGQGHGEDREAAKGQGRPQRKSI
jgi:hypothetical protein